jgi:hypothetical protein
MAKRYNRRTAPGVVNGTVQRKNRTALSPSPFVTPPDIPAILRERPGEGHRHLLKKRDIVNFVSILPDWEELSRGIKVILLATAEWNTDGWQNHSVVAVCAWERELWRTAVPPYYEDHAGLFARLGVPVERTQDGDYLLKFTEETAKAYQLLHVLLHELGHHHDRITTRSKRQASRGEDYAERYAHEYEALIWHRYFETFGLRRER